MRLPESLSDDDDAPDQPDGPRLYQRPAGFDDKDLDELQDLFDDEGTRQSER